MEGQAPQTNFSRWLSRELDSRGMAVRKLARQMAAKHPRGTSHETTETYRRALYKYLREGALPSRPMRAAIAEALEVGLDQIPEEDDDLPSARESEIHAALRPLARVLARGEQA